jgi:hypothetical protein
MNFKVSIVKTSPAANQNIAMKIGGEGEYELQVWMVQPPHIQIYVKQVWRAIREPNRVWFWEMTTKERTRCWRKSPILIPPNSINKLNSSTQKEQSMSLEECDIGSITQEIKQRSSRA